MIHLRMLGGAAIERDGSFVEGRAAQSHHLGLLALLATAPGRALTRERLIGVLWPESSPKKARHRLSVALHVLRRALGDGTLISAGDTVAFDSEIVRSDVGSFLASIEDGRFEDAVRQYSGPFLDGFYVRNGLDFERWAEGERDRLSGLFRTALERLIQEAERSRSTVDELSLRRRLATLAPYDSSVASGLIRALADRGDLASALAQARAHISRLDTDLGISPKPEIVELADDLVEWIRSREEGWPTLPTSSTEVGRGRAPAAQTTEADPSVLRESAPRESRDHRRVRAAQVIGGAVLAFALMMMLLPAFRAVATPSEGLPSVVVVPFSAVEADGGEADLAQELTNEVQTTLAYIPNLRVVEAPPVEGFLSAGPSRVEGEIVTHVVEGTVTTGVEGTTVAIALRDGASGEIRWERVYERDPSYDRFLTEALSFSIADDLRLRLAPFIPHDYTDSQASSDAFLQGVFEHRKLSEESMWIALQHYRRAWEEDPDNALAHAIAGAAYQALVTFGGLDRGLGYAESRRHIMEALAIDPTLPEAYTQLGRLQFSADLDFESAEENLRKATMLYPEHPDPRTFYAFYQLYCRRDFDGALTGFRHALELDPLNTSRSRDIEIALLHSRRYDEVPAQEARTWSIDSEVAASLSGTRTAAAYRELELYDEAVAEYLEYYERRGASPGSGLAMTYVRMGRYEAAERILSELEERTQETGVTLGMVQLQASLGDLDQAFAWLESLYERNPAILLTLNTAVGLDPLRGDPRFDDLLHRVGFGDC